MELIEVNAIFGRRSIMLGIRRLDETTQPRARCPMRVARRSLSCLSAIGIVLLAATGAASAQSATAPSTAAPSTAEKSGGAGVQETGPGWGSWFGMRPGYMMGPGMMHGPGMWGGRFGGPCDPSVAGMAAWRIDEIERVVRPTEAQRAALADLRAASTKAAEALKTACPRDIPSTSAQRMAFMEKRMEAMLEAIKTIHPAFDAFYAALSDEQKARLDAAGPRHWGWHWRWHS
jgi:LTXXQ motif family protein